jgi:hypothetical protein
VATRDLCEFAFLSGVDSVGGCGVGGPHESRVAAGDANEDRLGQAELLAALPQRAIRERRVGEGVVPELVTVADQKPHDVGVTCGLASNHEECSRDVFAP